MSPGDQDRVERESSGPDPSLLLGGWQENIPASWPVAARLSPGSKPVLPRQPTLPSQGGLSKSTPFPQPTQVFSLESPRIRALGLVRKHG